MFLHCSELLCASLLITTLMTASAKSGDLESKVQASLEGRVSHHGTKAGRIRGFCDPNSKTTFPPVHCKERFTECAAGTCTCVTGYTAKYFLLDDKYACFVENGRPCKSNLFLHNFGPDFDGPRLSEVVENWEKHIREVVAKDDMNSIDRNIVKRLKSNLGVWKEQMEVTQRNIDWGCASGFCNTTTKLCVAGRNPVLTDNAEEPLPVPVSSGPIVSMLKYLFYMIILNICTF